MTNTLDQAAKATAIALLREAFDTARRKGKADWFQMTTAVLKNRLLQITGNTFKVEDYTSGSVADFVRLFPELLRVDEAPTGPPIVTLLEAVDGKEQDEEQLESEPDDTPEDQVEQSDVPPRSPSTTTAPTTDPVPHRAERSRVRSDLWRAVMDWDATRDYVIDPVTGHARERVSGDSSALPSIKATTKDEYLEWRLEFIDGTLAETTDETDRSALVDWREHPAPSRTLPIHLQDRWLMLLRHKVAAHIRDSFQSVGLPPPDDLISTRTRGAQRATSATVEVAVATRQLRDIVGRCVDAMTYDELMALQLPASVIARIALR